MNYDINSLARSYVSESFLTLPREVQVEGLKRIHDVNEVYLHCEDRYIWQKCHKIMTQFFVDDYKRHSKKGPTQDAPVAAAAPRDPDQAKLFGNRQNRVLVHLNHKRYQKILTNTKEKLDNVFCDPVFVQPVLQALQEHILDPLREDGELVATLCNWIKLNAMYLPLGEHLLEAYQKDMQEESEFAKYVMKLEKLTPLASALSDDIVNHIRAFLAQAAEAHAHSYQAPEKPNEQPTCVVLSVKNGAGGHTAPHEAMSARLQERGWRVETIHYDTDITSDDAFTKLGITFADKKPMSKHLFITRWQMQKVEQKVSKIVKSYVTARMRLNPELFVDRSGAILLEKVRKINPKLIVTTLAYHWSWKSLAYRVPTAKTLLVASDVFFHQEALYPWYRQQALATDLRQLHFTVMTDDIGLLKSEAVHYDAYHRKKNLAFHSMIPLFEGLKLDADISVIGAPINPAFDAITDENEIERLRQKWHVPNGAMSVCISRGRLGYTSDLEAALASYQTDERLARDLVIHLVCGENEIFYNRLLDGEYKRLGPNSTVIAHPLREAKDFAELRAISTFDDIKAGGASTFEGWYLISKGVKSMLLLTPGAKLFWERSNCDGMEKWGVGRTVEEGASKIEIVKGVMQNGLEPIKQKFPDWKPLFDNAVERLYGTNTK